MSRAAAALLILSMNAASARAQTAGFNSDGSAYASGKRMRSSDTNAPAAPQPTPAQAGQINTVVGDVLGGALGGMLSAPAPAPYVHAAPKPVAGDDDETSQRSPGGMGDVEDILKGYHPPAPFDQDKSIAAQRAFVAAKVKYSQKACDPVVSAEKSAGVDCSCLMLIGNPQYFQRPDKSFVRTAQEQHDLMVAEGNDSLTATELEKGDLLYFRGDIDDPTGRIEHTGRVSEIEKCGQCGGCSAKNGDVCVKMIHAPHPGSVVSEVKTVLHKDADKKGDPVFCTHMKDGSIGQCLTGGGRFP